jgi:hypothetical protein
MSEQDDRLSGPGAGLSATGRTADDFDPGDAPAGGDYGDPSGVARAQQDEHADEGADGAEQPGG